MKNQGQFILSLRSKPPQSMKHRDYSALVAGGWHASRPRRVFTSMDPDRGPG